MAQSRGWSAMDIWINSAELFYDIQRGSGIPAHAKVLFDACKRALQGSRVGIFRVAKLTVNEANVLALSAWRRNLGVWYGRLFSYLHILCTHLNVHPKGSVIDVISRC